MKTLMMILLGMFAGALVAYSTRPTYLGGLIDPVANGQIDRSLLQTWAPTFIGYVLVGGIIGFVAGVLTANSKVKN